MWVLFLHTGEGFALSLGGGQPFSRHICHGAFFITEVHKLGLILAKRLPNRQTFHLGNTGLDKGGKVIRSEERRVGKEC